MIHTIANSAPYDYLADYSLTNSERTSFEGGFHCRSSMYNQQHAVEVEYLYNRGNALGKAEDTLFVRFPTFGVLDGVSQAWTQKPPRFPGKGQQTWGEYLSHLTRRTIQFADQETPLKERVLRANALVGELFTRYDLGEKYPYPQQRPAVVGAVAQITEGRLEIAHWGDAVAFALLNGSNPFFFDNQCFNHEEDLKEQCATLMAQHGREDFWDHYWEVLNNARITRVNNSNEPSNLGYGALNGQAEFEDFLRIRTFSLDDNPQVLLSTDGFFSAGALPPVFNEKTFSEACTIAQRTFHHDLEDQYAISRAEYAANTSAHEQCPEASAILLRFKKLST